MATERRTSAWGERREGSKREYEERRESSSAEGRDGRGAARQSGGTGGGAERRATKQGADEWGVRWEETKKFLVGDSADRHQKQQDESRASICS